MVWETRKISSSDDRHPRQSDGGTNSGVFYGHSEAVHHGDAAIRYLPQKRSVIYCATQPGVTLLDGVGPGEYPTAVIRQRPGAIRSTWVRVREDISHPRGHQPLDRRPTIFVRAPL